MFIHSFVELPLLYTILLPVFWEIYVIIFTLFRLMDILGQVWYILYLRNSFLNDVMQVLYYIIAYKYIKDINLSRIQV